MMLTLDSPKNLILFVLFYITVTSFATEYDARPLGVVHVQSNMAITNPSDFALGLHTYEVPVVAITNRYAGWFKQSLIYLSMGQKLDFRQEKDP